MNWNAFDLPFVGSWAPQRGIVQLEIREDLRSDQAQPTIFMLEGGGCVTALPWHLVFYPSWEEFVFETGTKLDDYELVELPEDDRPFWDINFLLASRAYENEPPFWVKEEEEFPGYETC